MLELLNKPAESQVPWVVVDSSATSFEKVDSYCQIQIRRSSSAHKCLTNKLTHKQHRYRSHWQCILGETEFEQLSRRGQKAPKNGMHAQSADSVVTWGMTIYHSLAGHSDDGDSHSDTVDDTSKALVEGTSATGCEGNRQVASCQLSLRRWVMVTSFHQRHGEFRSR